MRSITYLRPRAEVEPAIARYRAASRPVTTWIVLNFISFVVYVVALAGHRKSLGYKPFDLFIVMLAMPIISLITGRRDLRAVLLGRLDGLGIVVRGTAIAALLVAYQLCYTYARHHLVLRYGPYDPGMVYESTFGGPFSEETLFQVGLQTWLERWSIPLSVIVTSLLFNLIDMDGKPSLQHFLATGEALGPGILSLALVWRRYRSLGLCLFVHCGYNTFLSYVI